MRPTRHFPAPLCNDQPREKNWKNHYAFQINTMECTRLILEHKLHTFA